jgi:hypothetical protein
MEAGKDENLWIDKAFRFTNPYKYTTNSLKGIYEFV